MGLFGRQVKREFLLQKKQFKLIMNSCLFFSMIVIFFPLTMAPDSTLLSNVAPGLLWIAMLLALFLSADRLFQQDYDDGVIEQWLVSGYPLSLLIIAKILVHWILTLIPMLLLCPILGLLFKFNWYEMLIILLSFSCGTPGILFLCALAAVFSTSLQQKGILMALILFPLTIPIMIFGSASISAATQGLPTQGYLALLLAMSFLTMSLIPFAIAGVIRIVLSD